MKKMTDVALPPSFAVSARAGQAIAEIVSAGQPPTALPTFARWLSADDAMKHIAQLESDLNECREFIEDYVDVNDGDYGEPTPNRAMSLVSMIDQTLNGSF